MAAAFSQQWLNGCHGNGEFMVGSNFVKIQFSSPCPALTDNEEDLMERFLQLFIILNPDFRAMLQSVDKNQERGWNSAFA